MHSAWPTLALITIALAGCSDGGSSGDDGDDPFAGRDGRVTDTTGLLRGIVLDETISPIEGATVRLVGQEATQTSDAEGLWQFEDLPEGQYFFTVTKPGYDSIQQSGTVQAGVSAPSPVKVLLQRQPGTEPFVITVNQDGRIVCSYGTPLTYDSCAIDSSQEQANLLFEFEGVPDWIQTEVVWQSTQPSGENLYLVQAVCPSDNCPDMNNGDSINGFNDRFDEGTRSSPAVARADPGFIADQNLTGAGYVAIDVSADGPALSTGIALEQDFSAYVTYFYNVEPREGWTFVGDGAYQI